MAADGFARALAPVHTPVRRRHRVRDGDGEQARDGRSPRVRGHAAWHTSPPIAWRAPSRAASMRRNDWHDEQLQRKFRTLREEFMRTAIGLRHQPLCLRFRGALLQRPAGHRIHACRRDRCNAAAIVTDTNGLDAGEVSASGLRRRDSGLSRARPKAQARRPRIVVVQEVFGVHEHIKDSAAVLRSPAITRSRRRSMRAMAIPANTTWRRKDLFTDIVARFRTRR